MKIIDGLKTQPTRKGDVGDWDYHDLQSIIEADVNTWDDHNMLKLGSNANQYKYNLRISPSTIA